MVESEILNQNGCAGLCAEILYRTVNDYKYLLKDKELNRKEIYEINEFTDSDLCNLYCAIANIDEGYIKRELRKVDLGCFKNTPVKQCKYCGDKFYDVSNSDFCRKKCEKKYLKYLESLPAKTNKEKGFLNKKKNKKYPKGTERPIHLDVIFEQEMT